jgi:hypothetical protein
MSRTRIAAALLALGAIAVSGAPSSAAQRRVNFHRLHQTAQDQDALVERLAADLDATREMNAAEAAPFLLAATQAVLADFPDMPLGYRALLESGRVVASRFEHPVRVRALLAQAMGRIVEAPEAFAADADEVYPRVLRVVLRRFNLPVFDHATAVVAIEASLTDLSTRETLLPSALHGLAFANMAQAAAESDAHPGAIRLALTRGVASLGPEFPEPGRLAYLRAALVASGANAPVYLAHLLLEFFAAQAEGSDLPAADQDRLLDALAEAADIPDPAAAVAVMRAAFEELVTDEA